MNSTLRAALTALVGLLAPGAEHSGDQAAAAASPRDRTFAEQQYVAPAWDHGHVPISVDLYGSFGRVLDARIPRDG